MKALPLLLALLASSAHGAVVNIVPAIPIAVQLPESCADVRVLRITRRANDLLIYCPPNPAPWGTWKDAYVQCPYLHVRRQNGDLSITCN